MKLWFCSRCDLSGECYFSEKKEGFCELCNPQETELSEINKLVNKLLDFSQKVSNFIQGKEI